MFTYNDDRISAHKRCKQSNGEHVQALVNDLSKAKSVDVNLKNGKGFVQPIIFSIHFLCNYIFYKSWDKLSTLLIPEVPLVLKLLSRPVDMTRLKRYELG